jgi:hypothetical protein
VADNELYGDFVVVRRRDFRRLVAAGLPTQWRRTYDPADGPYPSPRQLRRRVGILFDVLLHLAAAIGIGVLAADLLGNAVQGVLVGIGGYVAVSFVHRIVLQSVIHTTLGKGVTGLMLIDGGTGRPPTMLELAKHWLLMAVLGVFMVVFG